MPIHNSDIVSMFTQVADLLEIGGANPFRVRAYRNAARTVGDQAQSVASMLEDGKNLAELPDIGEDLAGKIAEIIDTGHLEMLEELEREVPGELSELLEIAQLGPKRVATLHRELDIETIEDLKNAAEQKKIRSLEGFGQTLERKILKELERRQGAEQRTKFARAEQVVGPLVDYLEAGDGVGRVAVAGSFRRRRETVGDLDILVTCEDGSPVMDRFVNYEDVEEVIARGGTKSSVRLRGGLQVDLRVVSDESYGAALYYFTG